MTKSVRSRLKAIVTNRRQARRYKTRRAVALIAGLTFGRRGGTGLGRWRPRDGGRTGLSLSLPIDDKRWRELLAVKRSARVVLALPSGKINLSATIIHSRLLDVTD